MTELRGPVVVIYNNKTSYSHWLMASADIPLSHRFVSESELPDGIMIRRFASEPEDLEEILPYNFVLPKIIDIRDGKYDGD